MTRSPSKIQTMIHSSIPLIVDEDSALECISEFSGLHVISLDDCHTGMIPGIMLYEKEDEKQSLSIKQIREAIRDMSEKPYEGKNMMIFRDFDSASIEAMNASLKFLEEPPSYIILLLVVSNPENILETIRSRTITYFVPKALPPLSDEIHEATRRYKEGDVAPLIRLISTKKLEKNEAIQIALELGKDGDIDESSAAEKAIEDLMGVNESARNILDRLILKMD